MKESYFDGKKSLIKLVRFEAANVTFLLNFGQVNQSESYVTKSKQTTD